MEPTKTQPLSIGLLSAYRRGFFVGLRFMNDIDYSQFKDAELASLVIDQFNNIGNYWVPNGAQLNFIKLVGGARDFEENQNTWVESPGSYNFVNCFVAANGVGKTDVICHIAGTLLGVLDNPYFKDSQGDLYQFYKYPPASGKGRIISNPTNIVDNIVPKLLEILPKGTYRAEKKGKEYLSYFELTLPNRLKRSFNIMSYEQEVDKFAGSTIGWCLFDEPEDDPSKFIETTARFRRGGQIMITLCPLGSAAWVHDLVIGNTNWEVGAVYARIWANSTDPTQGIRGILEPQDIDRMIAGWDDDEYTARALGEFMHLRGRVYPMFDRNVHVIDPREIPREGTVYCVMDPHDSRPPFIGYFKVCPDGRIYMIKEWPPVETRGSHTKRKIFYTDYKYDSRTIDDYVKVIFDIEREVGKSRMRFMDGRFGNKRYPNSGLLVFEEYCQRNCDFDVAPVDPTLARGHAKVKALLQHDLTGEKTGRKIFPRMYISAECENTIRSFERYAFKVRKRGEDIGRELVSEIYKDPMDVVRMAADLELDYYDESINRKISEFNVKHSEDPAFAGMVN